jgi:hypothetical protein
MLKKAKTDHPILELIAQPCSPYGFTEKSISQGVAFNL